jgi:RimJ/RimL family protein N-acetyltransferase
MPMAVARGIATETVRRLVDLAFEHFGVWRVWATCAPQNPASRRVLEKVVMRHEGFCDAAS